MQTMQRLLPTPGVVCVMACKVVARDDLQAVSYDQSGSPSN